jgi:adenine deaminase
MQWEGVVGLGEMMNFPGVAAGDEKLHAEMAETRKAGKVIGGHYASPDLGLPFHAYAAGGAEDDHEGTRLEDAVARVRQGMKAMLRQGSAWHDVAEQARAVTEAGLDPRNFILCTDDSHSQTLVDEGHVDRAVRVAIAAGVKPITGVQMATLNAAEHFHKSREIGLIAPGRYADILIVPDLAQMKPDLVIAQGVVAAENGKLCLELQPYSYPEWALNSVKIGRRLSASDFALRLSDFGLPEDIPTVHAQVIGVIENQAPNRKLRLEAPVIQGQVQADPTIDLAKVALVERHRGSGKVQVGLAQGFGFNRRCAVASTVAHDSHHLIAAGTDDACLALAANTLAQVGGGQVVVLEGEVIALVELPIAGLMSNEHAAVVARKAAGVLEGFRRCGCRLNNPNMQLSLLALVVIPELRISDLGLVDVNRFELIPTLEP